MNHPGGRILVFAREPIAGAVKTRLIPALGADKAAVLYKILLQRSMAEASRVVGTSVELWCSWGQSDPVICESLASQYAASMYRQVGTDLGDRMFAAFSADPPTPDRPVVIIGSDCPAYTADYISRAFRGLRDEDAVLGPALDGGYVLLGLTRLDPSLFEGITWGGPEVLATTRRRLSELQWRWKELEPLRDIDTASDLAHFPEFASYGDLKTRGNEP